MRTPGTAGRLALVLALGAVVAGCGAPRVDLKTVSDPCGGRHWLTVYSDLPLKGSDGFDMYAIWRGEHLALEQAHKRAGPCHVQLVSYDDAIASTGVWDPGLTAQVAHSAASDPGAIAYIGDFESGATATSLQITNASDLLQISPWSPYVGFTDTSSADDLGDPGRYQSSGDNTFAGMVPSDYNQAAATAAFMAHEGVSRLFVLGDVSDPFDADIAALIANGAPQAGVPIVGYKANLNLETNTQPQGYAGIAADIAAVHADAVVLGGNPGPGALALWTELHTLLPHAKLFAPSTLATPDFLARLGSAAASTYVTTPILSWSQYPPAAQRMKKAYHEMYRLWPTKFALYGYEAMKDILAAIKDAHYDTTPTRLIDAFFHHLGERTASRGSVIGDYTIYPDGNTSLKTFDGDRVTCAGTPVAVCKTVPVYEIQLK